MTIHINYSALHKGEDGEPQVTDELLRKAKGVFGMSARKELLRLFDAQIRLLATEVAQRGGNPSALYTAGTDALLDALKVYNIGDKDVSFAGFATPYIKQNMQRAKSKGA